MSIITFSQKVKKIEDKYKNEGVKMYVDVDKMIKLFEDNERRIYGEPSLDRCSLFIKSMNEINEQKRQRYTKISTPRQERKNRIARPDEEFNI